MALRGHTHRLGRYELLRRLGVGGTSSVYLARRRDPGGFTKDFALKILHPHLDSTLRRRFAEETRLAARVRHPNMLNAVEAGHHRGLHYLAMELIDGTDLRRLTAGRPHPLSPIQGACIVAAIARGVHSLHEAVDDRGTPLLPVHRDLSPHNIMLDRDGRAVLIDLGLAKGPTCPETTEVGVLCGKLPYMSPEQARLLPLDRRSDVFALGTVLYELWTGTPPFGDDDSTATLRRRMSWDPAELAARLREARVPDNLAGVVAVCLQTDPEARFASAQELAEALDQELASLGVNAAAVRRDLASLVRDHLDHATTSQDPPLPDPWLTQLRRPWSTPVTWTAIGSAAMLSLFALASWTFGAQDRALADDRARAAQQASQSAAAIPQIRTAQTRIPSIQPTVALVPVPVFPELAVQVTAELPADDAAHGRKRSRGPRTEQRLPLKPNPY